MDFIKKALNLLLLSIILTFASICLAFGFGFAERGSSLQSGLYVASHGTTIAASLAMLFGCLFGKIGKNKGFTVAFWVSIGSIVFSVLNLVIGVMNLNIIGLIYAAVILNAVTNILVYLFIMLGCKEATPKVKKLAITTIVFLGLGIVLSNVPYFVKNLDADPIVACYVFGLLFSLVGSILFIILIIKSRTRYQK